MLWAKPGVAAKANAAARRVRRRVAFVRFLW